MAKKSGYDPTTACPYRGEAGYVRARSVRDKTLPGWLVLYDRAKGDPPGMQGMRWNELVRWVVMWRPPLGEEGEVLWRGLESEEKAMVALTWAAKGYDQLRLWNGKPIPAWGTAAVERALAKAAFIGGTKSGVKADCPAGGVVGSDYSVVVDNPPAGGGETEAARACAHNAQRAREEPCAHVRKESVSDTPVPAAMMPSVESRLRGQRLTREMQMDELLLDILPLKKAMEVLADIAQNATKSMCVGGDVIDDIPDNTVRMKALELYCKLLVLEAAKREKEVVQEALDDRHLYDDFMASVVVREEMERMLEEYKKTGIVTTRILGDPLVSPPLPMAA
jgi:hypothetical protein